MFAKATADHSCVDRIADSLDHGSKLADLIKYRMSIEQRSNTARLGHGARRRHDADVVGSTFRESQFRIVVFVVANERQVRFHFSGAMSFHQEEASSSFKKEARAADHEEEGQVARPAIVQPSRTASTVTDISSNGSIKYRKPRHDTIGGDGFWCGALRCMHLPLPGLPRRRPMQQQQSMVLSEAGTAGPGDTRASTVSKVASMERFKYSSSSSGIAFERADHAEEEDEEVSAYFDLPLELLRISSVDTESPVTAAFLFDGSRGRGAKKIVPEVLDLDFSFPAPPAFSSLSSPGSQRGGAR
jgi:hypothetical protein